VKVCMIALTLITGRPGYFNVNRINSITIEKQPFANEVTVVNKYYVKEKPEEVLSKIKVCSEN
jgi:uncharacterized protein YlzI (FlbEa/FlbD family)